MHRNNRITFEDVVLCDPITKRGKDALERVANTTNVPAITIGQFYDNVYVEPYFVDFSDDESGNPFFDNYTEYEFAFSQLGTTVRNLLDKKERYEERFFSKTSDSLLLIRGSAGSGKSIYLNYLKYCRSKLQELSSIEKTNHTINLEMGFDLESAQNTLTHGSVSFPSKKYSINDNSYADIDSPWHFFTMLLEAVYNLCEKIIDSEDQNVRTTLKNNFHVIFGDDYCDEIETLIRTLLETNTYIIDKRTWISTLFEQIIDSCFVDSVDVKKCIGKVLELLTRLIVMQSELSTPKQILISIDNIEHFINSTRRVYDEDIRTITTAVIAFVEDEKALYKKRGLNFAEFFKFVLVVRDTTDKMLSTNVHNRFNRQDCSIDVTGWYTLESICSKKLEYYHISDSSSIRFLNMIIDEGKNKKDSNLMQQLTSMYNHNTRRVTRILTRVASVIEEIDKTSIYNKNSINFEQFCKLWEYKSEGHVRYLCRQAIIRLIYNEISNTYFFDRIGCNFDSKTDTFYSYSRRILTWLHNKEGYNTERFFSFKELLQDLFFSPQTSNRNLKAIDRNALEKFCKVLVALAEHRFTNDSETYEKSEETEPNCWCQLIIIKYNSTEIHDGLTVDVLLNKLLQQFDNDSNIDEFGIRLTEAGEFFISRIRDYEYYACVSKASNIPLIFINNKNLVKSTIEKIYKLAKKSIDITLSFEYSMFSQQYSIGYKRLLHYKSRTNAGNTEIQSFTYRIIEQHMIYLSAYNQYLCEENLQAKIGVFNTTDLIELVECVDKYIDLYKGLLESIEKSKYCLQTGERIEKYILKK